MFDFPLSLPRKIARLTSLLGAIFLLSQNLHGMTPDDFLGVWHQKNRPEYAYLFAPDGTLSSGTMKDGKTFDGDPKIHQWTLQTNGELTIMFANDSEPTGCAIAGKELVVRVAHLQPYRLVREVPKATDTKEAKEYERWFAEQMMYAGDEADDESAQSSPAPAMPGTVPRFATPVPKIKRSAGTAEEVGHASGNGQQQLVINSVPAAAIQPAPETAVRAMPAPPAGGRSVSAKEVNGTWHVRDNDIRILALGQGKLRVEFDLETVFGKTANVGFASGEATIENDVAIFVPSDSSSCTITLKFLPKGELQVDEQGDDCPFGQRVHADGTYRKVSGAKPTFDNRY